jgi:Cdc6-like AAA superfamily ATPase
LYDDGATQVSFDESHQTSGAVVSANTTSSYNEDQSIFSPCTKQVDDNSKHMISLALFQNKEERNQKNDVFHYTGTDEMKLQQCLSNLDNHHNGNDPTYDIYDTTSNFAKNLNDIFIFLYETMQRKELIDSNEQQCKLVSTHHSKSALCICGVPGIGKTSGVKYCCSKAIEQYCQDRQLIAGGKKSPIMCCINAAHLKSRTTNEQMESIIEEIFHILEVKSDCTIISLKKVLKKQFVILVLDEIDVLISSASKSDEGILQALFELTDDPSAKLTMIGITNHLGDVTYSRLHSYHVVRAQFT